MAEQNRRSKALLGADANPLAFAVSENDRQTVAMVQAALHSGRMRLAYQPVVLGADPTRVAFHEGLIL